MVSQSDVNPKAAAAVNRLRRWAIDPAGGGKIFNWGTPGDFKRCEDFYREKGIPERMIPGWCATLHRMATGGTPGHAPGVEQAMAKAKHEAAVAKSKKS
jgi:hypothetical protein